jgi:hypothetical protein
MEKLPLIFAFLFFAEKPLEMADGCKLEKDASL